MSGFRIQLKYYIQKEYLKYVIF